jgi:hypothetical protein
VLRLVNAKNTGSSRIELRLVSLVSSSLRTVADCGIARPVMNPPNTENTPM